MPHPAALRVGRHFLIRPQIAAANTGARNREKCVSWLNDARVGNGFYADIARAIHKSSAHRFLRFEPRASRRVFRTESLLRLIPTVRSSRDFCKGAPAQHRSL